MQRVSGGGAGAGSGDEAAVFVAVAEARRVAQRAAGATHDAQASGDLEGLAQLIGLAFERGRCDAQAVLRSRERAR